MTDPVQDPRRRQWRDGGEWWLVMPMAVKVRAVEEHGSIEAAFEALAAPGAKSQLLTMMVGAVGVEFVGADEHVERFRFPWAVQPNEGGASGEKV